MTTPLRSSGFTSPFSRPPPVTLALMIASAVLSMVALSSWGAQTSGGAFEKLGFWPMQLREQYRFWTPFTYLFVADTPWNLIMYELFGLWMFGSGVERMFGPRRYLFYFFAAGAGGAFLATLLSWILPGSGMASAVGPWVAGEVLLLAWVLMNWNVPINFWMIPLKAQHVLAISMAIPAFYILTGRWEPFVPYVCALGLGYLLMRRRRSGVASLRAFLERRRGKRRARHLKVIPFDRDSLN